MKNDGPDARPLFDLRFLRFERGLLLGPGLALFGLFTDDAGLTSWGAVIWVLIYGYYAPWVAHMVRLRTPEEDHHLAAAVLGWAAAPWALFLTFGETLTESPTIHASVLAFFAVGAAAIFSTTFAWKRRPSPLRSVFLLSGGLVYLGWAAAYGWLAMAVIGGAPAPIATSALTFAFLVFGLPTPFFALWVGVRLLVAPLEDPAPHPPGA